MVTGRGRGWFAATAATVLVGVAIQVVVSGTNEEGLFPTAAGRIFNVFCFFTVVSNLLVAATSAALARRPDRPSEAFAALRLAGLVMIAVTAIVYHVALAHIVDLDGWGKVADQLLHTVVPLLAIGSWLRFGPFGRTSPRTARLAVLPPLAWIVFALVRGELIDYYPYPFVDVNAHGYARVALNTALISLLFLALATSAVALDRRRALPESLDIARRAV